MKDLSVILIAIGVTAPLRKQIPNDTNTFTMIRIDEPHGDATTLFLQVRLLTLWQNLHIKARAYPLDKAAKRTLISTIGDAFTDQTELHRFLRLRRPIVYS